MRDKLVCVEVETNDSSSELTTKVVIIKEGTTYEYLVNEICKRCNINCDLRKVHLKFKARVTDRSWDEMPYVPLTDDYDVSAYFCFFDEHGVGPTLRVLLADNSAVVEKANVFDSLTYVESNDLGVVNDLIEDNLEGRIASDNEIHNGVVNDLNEDNMEGRIASDNEIHIRDETYAEDNLGVADIGEKAGDEEHVECEEATEIGVLELDKFHLHPMELDNLGDLVTNENKNEAIENETLKFGDGSNLCVGKIFDSKEDATKHLKMIAMKGNFQYKTKRSTLSLLVVACVIKGCTWRVRLRKMGTSKHFEIRTYVGAHSCGLESASKRTRHTSYDLIAELCMSRFDCGKGPSPKEIQSLIHEELGCDVSYWKAWKARQSAIKKAGGSPEPRRKKVKQIPSSSECPLRAKQKKKCPICRKEGHYKKCCPEKNPDEVTPVCNS